MKHDIRLELRALDHALIWHPYAPAHVPAVDDPDIPLVIQSGHGASLFDPYGREYIDMMSSWWLNIHGHAHPTIAQAIYEQARTLEHVMFADITHAPAVRLAQQLQALLPPGFSKFFYSDNGSTAVEVALKILYQYWHIQGQPQRDRFLTFAGGYHGDTLGAMSVSKGCGFFTTFEKIMFAVDQVPFPATWDGDPDIDRKETDALAALTGFLDGQTQHYVGMILEPLVQGASGMRMCRPSFLKQIVEHCRSAGVPVIFDEVMTGFGRTGSMWACEQAAITPDIICLSKGLTGGFLPLALTVCQRHIADAFQGETMQKALVHGHSYTANPIACAAGLASLQLYETERTLEKFAALAVRHRALAETLRHHPKAQAVRTCGSILAFDIVTKEQGYGAAIGTRIKHAFFAEGFIVRPLGTTVYFMPPACLTPSQQHRASDTLITILDRLDNL